MAQSVKFAWEEITNPEVKQVQTYDDLGVEVEGVFEEVIEEVGTGNGWVTGINRDPMEGERGGTVLVTELCYGYSPEGYSVVDNKLTQKSESVVIADALAKEKDAAFLSIIDSIDSKNSEENLKDFEYTVDGIVYGFYADADSLSTVEGNCLSKIQRGADLSDPVPAPNGVWKTTSLSSGGVLPQYVALTMEDFLGLTDTLTERGISNFGVKEYHKNALKAIYADSDYDASDILAYDFSTGWV